MQQEGIFAVVAECINLSMNIQMLGLVCSTK